MILVGVGCLIAVLQSPASDSLRLLAVSLPQTSLVLQVRERPLAVRDAVTESLRRGELDAAGKIAAAYAVAWRDSFLVREVARFVAWPADRRSAKVWVDSVRRVGITAFGRDGPGAAVVVWRRALARAAVNNDSAGGAAPPGKNGGPPPAEGRPGRATASLGGGGRPAGANRGLRGPADAAWAVSG